MTTSKQENEYSQGLKRAMGCGGTLRLVVVVVAQGGKKDHNLPKILQ